VLEYKYSVKRSDQMLLHYSFERNTKLWRKLSRKIRHWKFSMTKSLKGVLLASDSTEMRVQGQTNTTAGRLVGRDHSIHSISATHSKLVGKSQCQQSVQRRTRQTGKAVKTYYNILLKMLCRILCWAEFWIELHKNVLLEVKVTTVFIFIGSATKSLYQHNV
jgi:hypothetical protein